MGNAFTHPLRIVCVDVIISVYMTSCPRCFVFRWSLYNSKLNEARSGIPLVKTGKSHSDTDMSSFSVKKMLISFPLKQLSVRRSWILCMKMSLSC
jgi:hypothetical protein